MRKFVALLLLIALTGCDESMDKQNRLKTYGSAPGITSWPSDGEALPLVAGTVPQGALDRDAALRNPPTVSLALLQRGRERYNIYCSACHGLTGGGDGIVVARGFPKPKPFDDPAILKSPAKHLVDVIGNGYGVMYSFSDRVDPKDRWAIAVYIRALQLADRSAKP
ncbi:MAG TPA: cytochrome c [Rhizomicrobium sp.]|jgi:mono/diheme cytochrome c family protein